MKRSVGIAALTLLALALAPLELRASSHVFAVLIDADQRSATGCTVTVPAPAFAGADALLATTIAVDEATGVGTVMSVTAFRCVGGMFGSPLQIDSAQWPAAGPDLVVETRFSQSQLRQALPAGFPVNPTMRLAFAVGSAVGPGGNNIVNDGAGPILFPGDVRRRRPVGSVRKIELDGRKEDWGAISPYVAGAGAPAGVVRLNAAYAAMAGETMYFRFDGTVPGVTFRATPDASPRAGPAPLAVTFVTRGEYSGGQILRYRWDFQGDGIFDTDEPGARNFTRTFTTPGVYNAILEITNDKSVTATAALAINVTGKPPAASAFVTPSNGPIPLLVTLTGSATPGSAPIVRYEWDFQGDGTFDFTSGTTGSTTYRYETAGTFNAVFRVTDNAGLQATARATATAVRAGPPGSPSARITTPSGAITRATGASISFNGTGSTGSGTITKYEWDFQGDGTYDFTSASTASTTHTYPSPGTFTVALRVTSSGGLTAIATVDVTVTMTATLAVSSDTLRPPGTVNVTTSIGGTAPVTVFLKNKAGQTVRTLVNNVTRTAGNYTDAWDGLGSGGAPLPEGVYYAVLRYATNGSPVVVDPSATTGNSFYNPSWQLSTTKGGSCFDCPFAPYENNFLQAAFELEQASEVTVSIRGYDTVNEIALLFDRRPFGRDRSYAVVWEGTNAIGQLVLPSLYDDSQFIFGVTAFTLPDNAIFVELAPDLSNVTVTPNYFDPATSNYLSPQKPTAVVTYRLSKQATVRLQVYRAGTNVVLRTIDRPNAPAADGTMIWDGKDDHGIFADKGDYRLAVRAIDAAGNQSLVRYALVRVFY